jgi:hypothetical protein
MTKAPMNKFLDRDHPMFKHLWVRLLTVAVPGGMAVLEFTKGGPGWAVVFGAAAVWAAWELFLRK